MGDPKESIFLTQNDIVLNLLNFWGRMLVRSPVAKYQVKWLI